MVMRALITQTKFQFADHELVEQITENPYLQYFIWIPRYQEEALFDAGTLVLFRKRITAEILMEANEYLLAHWDEGKNDTPPTVGGSGNPDVLKEDATKAHWYWMRPVRQSISITCRIFSYWIRQGKTGDHYLSFLQILWPAAAKALQQAHQKRLSCLC